MYGGVEAGGTKFVCGIGTGPEDLRLGWFPTTSPEATVASVAAFFREQAGAQIDAVGIASFGPVDLHPESPTFGYITSSPKLDWQYLQSGGRVGSRAECAGGLRYGRKRGSSGGGALGRGARDRGFHLPHRGHGNWRRRRGARRTRTRPGASGDGTHSRAARPRERSVSGRLSLSSGLPGRAGCRSDDGGAVGSASARAAHRSSRLGARGKLSRTRPGNVGVHAFAEPNRDRRRRHAAATPVSHGAPGIDAPSERLHPGRRADG